MHATAVPGGERAARVRRVNRPSRRQVALVLVFSILLAGLPALALASPLDPVWIPGVYDGDDRDDLVALAASALGDAATPPRGDASPALPATEDLSPAHDDTPAPAVPPPVQPRGPPPAWSRSL